MRSVRYRYYKARNHEMLTLKSSLFILSFSFALVSLKCRFCDAMHEQTIEPGFCDRARIFDPYVSISL